MKKTLLATAIAGTMVATGAQAATVYDQDGTKLDIYGRVVYGLTTGGPESAGTATVDDETFAAKSDGSEIIDLGSRWGFRANHQVTSDMSVFARMEFRGKADAQNSLGFDTIRNTYVGVDSQSWGNVMVGNFDSVYYRSGDVIFDVPENAGWEQLGGISAGSRGDSISYSTPNLTGFRAHVQAKHLSGNGAPENGRDNSSTWTGAAAVDYTINDLYMSLAYNQGKDVSDRGASHDSGNGEGFAAGEDLVGFFANYQLTPAFSLRFKYEEITDTVSQDEMPVDAEESILGVGASYDYGMGEIYGQYARIGMAWDGDAENDAPDDKDRWMLGANYRFSEPMYVFAEVYQQDDNLDFDASISDNVRSIDDELLTTVGVRYDF